MIVDIAPHQNTPEVFAKNRSSHRSTPSNTHARDSPAESDTAMTNGQRFRSDELGKKAEQILGRAPAVVDYRRQASIDYSIRHPLRLNINASPTSRAQSSKSVHNQQKPADLSPTKKDKQWTIIERLVPLILQLVAPLNMTKLPETISRHSSRTHRAAAAAAAERDEDVLGSHGETSSTNPSDDENEETSDTVDHTFTNQNQDHEHPIELQPIDGQTRDSDDQLSTRSDAENDDDDDDESNQLNPNTLSLIDFLPATHSNAEPVTHVRKRSRSPQLQPTTAAPSSIKQTKRKQALIRSFSSSVNIPIDIKQPSLPIAIPKHLFFDQSNSAQRTSHGDDSPTEKSKKTSKRYADGSIKHETSADMIDDLASPSTVVQGATQKRNKTSHAHEKVVCKQEPLIVSTTTGSTTAIKTEFSSVSNVPSISQTSYAANTATVAPMILQPKKEKPTANVKPLLQSTLMDSSSSAANNAAVGNASDRFSAPLSSTSNHYTRLKTMSIKHLHTLARQTKKQADGNRRSTAREIQETMSLYLESVCYFTKCANDEPSIEQRTALLTSTLAMLQQLAQTHQQMFHITTSRSTDLLSHLRQKFLLINYWLQAFIYQLQFHMHLPLLDRCAHQVVDYFHQSKSPLSTNSSDTSHPSMYEFSKYMLSSYQSNFYWNKADRLMHDASLKEFLEQLLRQNQNRRLTRDDRPIDFISYIFHAIDSLRSTIA